MHGVLTTILFLILSAPVSATEVIRHGEQATGGAALLFLHGLGSDHERGFTHPNGQRWQTLIQREGNRRLGRRRLGGWTFYSIDYSDALTLAIEEIAVTITGHSRFQSLFHDHNHLFFVAHSLGGLVLKRVLLQMQQRGQTPYLNRILGAALLGVPTAGSPLADAANDYSIFGRPLANWLGVELSQVRELQTVEAGNTFLLQLQNDWNELVERRLRTGFPFHIACAYETRPEVENAFVNVTVVPRFYTTNAGCSGRPMPLNASHTMLPKPADQNAPVHDWLLVEINRAIRRLEGAEIVSRESWMSLDDLLTFIDMEHGTKDHQTGLPYTPPGFPLSKKLRE